MERETEHVRMVDAGRLRLACPSPLSPDAFARGIATFQLVAHGNKYGATFAASPEGFVMSLEKDIQKECRAYLKRKVEAIDHGHGASHVEIDAVATHKTVALAGVAHQIALSHDELHLAVAYGSNLALFEVATILNSPTPAPYQTFDGLKVEQIAWRSVAEAAELTLAVVTSDRRVVVCRTDGSQDTVRSAGSAAAVCWSPNGEQFAIGTTEATVDVFGLSTLEHERTIKRPDCCDEGFEAHHVKWAEDDLILVGYKKFNVEYEETEACLCIFEAGACVELDQVVAFCDVENRKHEYYSTFLPDWRMFFVGCSLSADIELLVADPDTAEWEVWKPSEKFQARLPMTADDEETYPVGMFLNLNASDDVIVDDGKYPPSPILTCATTDGLLLSFSFIDLSVAEKLDFVTSPLAFSALSTRSRPVPGSQNTVTPPPHPTDSSSDVENIPASEDSDDDDIEEILEEERENARDAFKQIDKNGDGHVQTDKFKDLLEALGTTYCEETHVRFASALADGDGKIKRDAFVNWYAEWVCGDLESDDEDDSPAATSQSNPNGASVLDKFRMKEGEWRCDVCLVQNSGKDQAKCASCESPNPHYKGEANVTASLSQTTASAPASSKFTFGIPSSDGSTKSASTGFSFGLPSGSVSAVPATASGFSFGSAKATVDSFGKPTGSTAVPGSSPNLTGGFSFGITKPDATPSNASVPKGSKEPKSTVADSVAESAYGKDVDNTFAESDGESDDEEAERKEEEDKARAAFKKVAPSGSLVKEQFPALFKALGTTFDEDEHAEVFDQISVEGSLTVDTFIEWYLDWLFAEDDSDDDEEEVDSKSSKEPLMNKQNVFDKFRMKEGEWKCQVCMVSNPDVSARACAACEAPNPNVPASKSTGPTFTLPSQGNASFQFGIPATSTNPPSSTNTKGGFTFGIPNKNNDTVLSTASGDTNVTPSMSSATKPGGFTFGIAPKPSAVQVSTEKPHAPTKPTPTMAPGYPPDTSTKPKPPAAPGYPPDTSTKPKPPAAPGYPPDTSTKPKPPAAPGYPPDTSTKPKPPAAPGYPPDTSTKPKPPAAPGYPPDTSAKPKPPAAPGYPPETSAKPKPPAAPGYPPDTSTKPKPPAAPGYPPDTSTKPKPPSFGSFGSVGSNPVGASKPDSGGFMSFSAFNASLPMAKTGTVSLPAGGTDSSRPSLFAAPTAADASSKSSPSPFGVVPKTGSFSFGAMSTTSSSSSEAAKAFSLGEKPKTSNGQGSLFGSASMRSGPSQQTTSNSSQAHAASVAAPKKTTELPQAVGSRPTEKKVEAPKRVAQPSSAFEAQLWRLIVEFDRSMQRTKATSTSILSLDPAFNSKFTSELKKLQVDVAKLSADVNKLDESRDSVEKDVLFVIGSDGDVHEQLEYSREILASFKDEKLLKLLEDQPLDQRSIDARQSLLSKLRTLERSCDELDSHLDGTTNSMTGRLPSGVNVSSAHLFRTLKHTYDTSKLQYNMVCHLAQQVEALNLKGQSATNSDIRQMPVQSRASSKQDVMDMLVESESRTANVRQHFLDLCKNVVTPRDVFTTRRKLSQSPEATSPRAKAFSRLMPKSQVTVASPVSVTKVPPRISKPPQFTAPQEPSVSSKLIALAEQKASNQAPTLIQPPAKQKPAVTFAPERPSINSLDPKPTSDAKKKLIFGSAADKSEGNESVKSNVKPPSLKPFSLSQDKETESKADDGGNQNTMKPKPSVSFTIPEKTRPTISSYENSLTSGPTVTIDYKERLRKFYEVHNPAKLAHVDKTVDDFKGKENELFSRLFDKYVPGSTEDTVKKFLDGGPVPPKPSAGASAPAAAPANKVSFAFPKSPAGPAPSASPFGKSTFNLGVSSSSNKTQSQSSAGSSFGGFGGQKPQTQSSPGGIDYRQKLVEFYQQHNPTKLGDVDSTLAKYKGNEAKLFQNLSIKYKTANPLGAVSQSPALPPKSPGSSPFGNPGAFSSISLGGTQSAPSFGSTNQIGFGAKPSGSASPAQTPFVTSPPEMNSFRSIGSGSFTAAAPTQPAFGGAVSSSPAFGAASQLGGGSTGFGLTPNSAHRDRLVKFYQQYNPDKLKDVDSTLEKYKGNEEKLFKMLEQKYVTGVPAQPNAFGAPAASGSPFGGGSGFGAPSPLGGTTGAPAFGSASALGGGAASAAPSFGASSRLGGTGATAGFGSFSAPAASSGAATTGSGFGSFSGQATFGAFGGQQSGSGFGGNTSSGFGSANGGFGSGGGFGGQGFAGSSFTQMR